MIDIKACMHNLSKALETTTSQDATILHNLFPHVRESGQVLLVESGFWNPENNARNAESHKRLESGIQVPPSKSDVECRIQHCLGHPYGAICMILTVKPQTKWRQSNKSADVVFLFEDNSDRLETSLVFNFKTKSSSYDALS